MVKNLPASEGDISSIPNPGRSHMGSSLSLTSLFFLTFFHFLCCSESFYSIIGKTQHMKLIFK